MDPAFQRAATTRTDHVVFGLRLYPLTLGHVFLLAELDVNFLVDDMEPSFEDLLTFTFASANRTAREARRAVSSPLARPLFWFWGRVCRRKDLGAERDKLLAYVRSQHAAPATLPPKGEVKYLNAPEHWRLLTMLMADFHMTRDQAMATTLNFARALWAAQGERTDKLTLAWTPATSAAFARRKAAA